MEIKSGFNMFEAPAYILNLDIGPEFRLEGVARVHTLLWVWTSLVLAPPISKYALFPSFHVTREKDIKNRANIR